MQTEEDVVSNEISDMDWLKSEEAKKMLLMIEDDIYREGNYIQRNFNFSGDERYFPLYIGIFIAIYTSILLGFSFLDGGFYFLVALVGFFVSLLSTLFICGLPFSSFLLFRSSIKKTAQKFGSTENFMAFLTALNSIYFLDKSKENYESNLAAVKENLKGSYNCVDSLYSNHIGFNYGSAGKLAKEFEKIFVRVRYAKHNSLRSQTVDKLISDNNSQAKEAMFEYFKKSKD